MQEQESMHRFEPLAGSACTRGRHASLGASLIEMMRRDKQDVQRALHTTCDPAELLGGYYERVDASLARLRQLRSEHARQAAGNVELAGGIAPQHHALPWDDDFLGKLELELRISGRWQA